MKIGEVLEAAVARNAADVLISAGAPITFHVFGQLEPYQEGKVLTPEQSENLVYQLLTPAQAKIFETDWEHDLAFQLRDIARFRVSVYRQRGTVAAVLRLVPIQIPHHSEIGLVDRLLMQIVNTPNGLVLVTGPTGAGKSTTVASYLRYLNTEETFPRHIITIEDPIEFAIPSKVCVVDQREIGSDTKGYAIGLRSALRQMPHVIFVGEMRDRETMEVALTAAETGNLVISTLSTQSASKTINRIIDVFPVDDQVEIRTRLALTLKLVISQVLLRRTDLEGRIAAREILIVNNAVSNLIREGKIHQINNIITASHEEGMVLLDDSLLELHRQRIVAKADVVARMQDTEKVRELLRSR